MAIYRQQFHNISTVLMTVGNMKWKHCFGGVAEIDKTN